MASVVDDGFPVEINNNNHNHDAHNDESDSLDAQAFLRSVRELSEKREKEDAARYRKLEEDVAREKAKRAVRRAGTWVSFFNTETHDDFGSVLTE